METTPTSREGEMKGRDNEAMERDEGDQNTRREGGKIHHHHHQEGRDNETIERDEGDHNTRREGGKNHQEGRDNEAMEGDEGYHQNTRRYSEKCSNDHHKNINVFSTISEGNDTSDSGRGPWWGTRHTLGFLIFLGLMLGYMVRINLSIAIVAMVGSKPSNDTNNFTEVCTYPDEEVEQHYIEGDLDWDEKTQGLVLGSFFYGYTASNFMWGRAAEYLGGRLVFGLGVVVPSVLSLFSALCASVSKDLFIVLRVLEGLAQGSLYPASSFLLTAWIPPKELTSYGAYVFSGATFGTIVALGSGGWLCDSEFLGGWPSIFYVFGVLGVLWGLPWFLMVHDLPEQHPNIDSTELTYITTHRTFVKQDKNVSLPVLEIVKSVPFWSVMVVSFGYNYITYLLLTETPTYFANIQHVNLANNGYISGLLYAVQFLLLIAWGAFLAILSDKNLISVNISRKLSTALGMYVPAVAMIAMMWVDCNNTLAMVVMGIGIGANGLVVSGAEISPNDISPNFAGSIKGISNTVGAMTGFVAPLITGLIINNNQTLRAWNTVFVIGAVVSSIPATHFLIWGTDKVQPWNEPTPKTKQSVTSRTE